MPAAQSSLSKRHTLSEGWISYDSHFVRPFHTFTAALSLCNVFFFDLILKRSIEKRQRNFMGRFRTVVTCDPFAESDLSSRIIKAPLRGTVSSLGGRGRTRCAIRIFSRAPSHLRGPSFFMPLTCKGVATPNDGYSGYLLK